MKQLVKKISVFLMMIAVLVAGTIDVYAVTGTQVNADTSKATVTVESVEAGTTLNLYKIVEPDIDATTDQLKGYKFTSTADGKLIDPNKEVELSSVADPTVKKKVKASELDMDNDGVVDTFQDGKVTIEGVEYTVGTYTNDANTAANPQGKVLYDKEAPNAMSVSLAVANGAYGSTADYTGTAAANTDYVQAAVKTGQYIGILTPPSGSQIVYNPIVLSAGYKGMQKYRLADTATHPEDATADKFYKRLDGTFTQDAPTADTKHLYEAEAWNGTAAADPRWVADGTTTEDQLIAGNVDPAKNYNTPIQGTTGVAKKSTPGVLKEASTDFFEDGQEVPVVASLANGDPKYSTERPAQNNPDPDSIQLVYIKKPATPEMYNNLRDGNMSYKLVDGQYVECDSSDPDAVTLEAMETLDAHLAATASKRAYSAGQGERIDYKLTPTVPQYPANAKNKTFVLTDKMGDGITFTPGSIELSFESNTPAVVKSYDISASGPQYKFYVDTNKTFDSAVNSDGKWFLREGNWVQVDSTASPAVVPADGTKLYDLLAEAKEVAPDGTLVDGNTFQINFNYDGLPGAEGFKVAPKVTYNAIINENAIKGISGNVNVATMYFAKNFAQGETWDEWRKPSGEDYNERHDEGVVYTYEIKFRKTNDKEEFIEDQNGTLVALAELDEHWTAEQKARYNELLDGATPWYKASGTVDQYGKLIPDAYLIELSSANQTGDDALYVASPKYKSNAKADGGDFDVLSGAVFGLYKTADCKEEDKVAEITTNDKGIGHTTLAHGNDTYYLKEITPPTGYSLNTTVYPVKPTWTSASTWSTDTVNRYVYSIVDYTTYPAAVADFKHTGWLVAETDSSTNGKYYDMNGNDPSAELNTQAAGRYFGHGNGDGVTEWKYDYTTKTMTKGNVVVKYVFPATVDKQTQTTETRTDTVFDNNGGTLYLARVNNTKTSELPSTGGIGTYIFTIAGVAILALAAFMLIFRKRDENA